MRRSSRGWSRRGRTSPCRSSMRCKSVLSSLAEVLDRADGDASKTVKAGVDAVEQDASRVFDGGQVGPPAVVAELVLEVAPDPLDEVQLGAVCRQPERADAGVV